MRKIIITGTNKGLGLALVKQICKKYPENLIVMTARDEKKGLESLNSVREEFKDAKIDFLQLDVTDSASIDGFIKNLDAKYKSFDVLVNNAGIGYHFDFFGSEGVKDPKVIKETFECNFFGLIKLTEKLLPYMAEDGKIINFSSLLGELSYQPKWVSQLLSEQSLKKEEIVDLANEFIKDFTENKLQERQKRWAPHAYNMTKCLVNAYTKAVLSAQIGKNQSAYCLKPGWCATDMGTKMAPLTPEQGTVSAMRLIFEVPFGRDDKLNGNFFDEQGKLTSF